MISSFSFSDNTVGFLLEGEFSTEQCNKLHEMLKEKFNDYSKINLYLEDANIESFSLQAVFDNVLFKYNHADQFNKIALVTDRKWIHLCGKLNSLFVSGEVRSFPSEDRLKAMSWIAQPSGQ